MRKYIKHSHIVLLLFWFCALPAAASQYGQSVFGQSVFGQSVFGQSVFGASVTAAVPDAPVITDVLSGDQ